MISLKLMQTMQQPFAGWRSRRCMITRMLRSCSPRTAPLMTLTRVVLARCRARSSALSSNSRRKQTMLLPERHYKARSRAGFIHLAIVAVVLILVAVAVFDATMVYVDDFVEKMETEINV